MGLVESNRNLPRGLLLALPAHWVQPWSQRSCQILGCLYSMCVNITVLLICHVWISEDLQSEYLWGFTIGADFGFDGPGYS